VNTLRGTRGGGGGAIDKDRKEWGGK